MNSFSGYFIDSLQFFRAYCDFLNYVDLEITWNSEFDRIIDIGSMVIASYILAYNRSFDF